MVLSVQSKTTTPQRSISYAEDSDFVYQLTNGVSCFGRQFKLSRQRCNVIEVGLKKGLHTNNPTVSILSLSGYVHLRSSSYLRSFDSFTVHCTVCGIFSSSSVYDRDNVK